MRRRECRVELRSSGITMQGNLIMMSTVKNIVRVVQYFSVVVTLLHLSVPAASAGWIADIYTYNKVLESVGIRYSADDAKGYKTIKGALDEILSKDILDRLDYINISELLQGNAAFQKEILSELRLRSLTQLNAALQSAGNMGNPKIRALYGPFAKAVLHTATVKLINEELGPFGIRIVEASSEKLTLLERNEVKYFDAILYLYIGRK